MDFFLIATTEDFLLSVQLTCFGVIVLLTTWKLGDLMLDWIEGVRKDLTRSSVGDHQDTQNNSASLADMLLREHLKTQQAILESDQTTRKKLASIAKQLNELNDKMQQDEKDKN